MKNFVNNPEMENEASDEEIIKEGERRREEVRTEDQIRNTHPETHGKHENREHNRDEPASVEESPEYEGGEFRNGDGDPSRPADPRHPKNNGHEGFVEHNEDPDRYNEDPEESGENPDEGSGENPDKDSADGSGENPDEGSGGSPNNEEGQSEGPEGPDMTPEQHHAKPTENLNEGEG